jgi:predicted dinucleotide-utilizing enzyme
MISWPTVQKVRNVAVAGLGVIGRAVCRALDTGIPGLRLSGALARDRRRAEVFLASLDGKPPFLPLDDLVAAADLVVEASTQAHLEELAPRVLGAGRDLVVLSCGGLLGRQDWIALAEANGCRIYVPSGAIAGLDGVKGARIGAVTSVTMETRNTHRVAVEGEFGHLAIEIANVPSENPRTGKLSAFSAIALLRDLGAPLRVGT